MPADLNEAADNSPCERSTPRSRREMIARIDAAKPPRGIHRWNRRGDLRWRAGGIGVPRVVGQKLDGRLAAALMSIPAVKAVEIGLGVEGARRKGSDVHDEIDADERNVKAGRRAQAEQPRGRIEGGNTLTASRSAGAAMKPISTLMRPLGTIEMKTREPAGGGGTK